MTETISCDDGNDDDYKCRVFAFKAQEKKSKSRKSGLFFVFHSRYRKRGKVRSNN